MSTRPKKSSEFELISRFFAPLAKGEPGAFDLTDDAASIDPGQGRLVVTADTLVSGVHFPENAAADLIAVKLLGVNLSDLAAMGAEPFAYTLSLAMPEMIGDAWLESFARSLEVEQEACRVTLIGGDTVATAGPLVLTMNMFGRVEEGGELLRSAACPGDIVYVSGTIGDAALGLLASRGELPDLAAGHRVELIDRYHRPRPRMELGRQLAGIANAATDVSDGLVADLCHICEASGVSATVRAAEIPLSEPARAVIDTNPTLISTVLSGGDDYELVFTASADSAKALDNLSCKLKLPLTPIGQIASSDEGKGAVVVIGEDGNEIKLAETGYRHR